MAKVRQSWRRPKDVMREEMLFVQRKYDDSAMVQWCRARARAKRKAAITYLNIQNSSRIYIINLSLYSPKNFVSGQKCDPTPTRR